MSTVFIYALKDPDTGQIRYVGKTKNPTERLNKHTYRCLTEKHHRACWVNSLCSRGQKPILEIIDEVPESEWQQWEVAYIAYFSECGYDLTNSTPGGEGVASGQIPSPETRAKMSAAKAGKRNYWFGKKWSLEHRAKMSGSRPDMSGKNHPLFGKTPSLETRAKLSVSNTGKKHSAEAREKVRLANVGKKVSPETRAKMSASQNLRQEKLRQAAILAEMWD